MHEKTEGAREGLCTLISRKIGRARCTIEPRVRDRRRIKSLQAQLELRSPSIQKRKTRERSENLERETRRQRKARLERFKSKDQRENFEKSSRKKKKKYN